MDKIQRDLNKLFVITHGSTSDDVKKLYKKLITEEYNELMAEENCTADDFKELCDLIWVCIQYANSCEYDLSKGMEALFDEYASKLYTKEGKYEPLFREDGKLLKNTGFVKADFKRIYKK